MMVVFVVWIVFMRLEQKANLNHIKSMWKQRFLWPYEFNHCWKSDKALSIIHADPEKSSTTKVGEHIPCGYSMPTLWI